MKVVILGKGEMLSNLIEGTLDAGCKISGVLRYERTVMPKFLLGLRDFFKSSSDVTIIKQHKLHEIKCCSANCEEFKKEIIKLNADIILVGTWHERLKKDITENKELYKLYKNKDYKEFWIDDLKELKEKIR